MKKLVWFVLIVFFGGFFWLFQSTWPTFVPTETSDQVTPDISLEAKSGETSQAPKNSGLPTSTQERNLTRSSVTITPLSPVQSPPVSIDSPLPVAALRGKDGRLLLMDQLKAIAACKEQGMHLPTARELAKIIRSRGGKGLWEEGKAARGESIESYGRIIAKNSDGQIDDFHYSNEGYKSPGGDLGDLNQYSFVSSSIDANPENSSELPCVLGLNLDRYGRGFISCTGFYSLENRVHVPDELKNTHNAVLCVGNE